MMVNAVAQVIHLEETVNMLHKFFSIGLVLLLGACASGGGSAPSPAPTPTTLPATAPATVQLMTTRKGNRLRHHKRKTDVPCQVNKY